MRWFCVPCVCLSLYFKLSNGSNVPTGIPGGGGSHLCNHTQYDPYPSSHFSMSQPSWCGWYPILVMSELFLHLTEQVMYINFSGECRWKRHIVFSFPVWKMSMNRKKLGTYFEFIQGMSKRNIRMGCNSSRYKQCIYCLRLILDTIVFYQ